MQPVFPARCDAVRGCPEAKNVVLLDPRPYSERVICADPYREAGGQRDLDAGASVRAAREMTVSVIETRA